MIQRNSFFECFLAKIGNCKMAFQSKCFLELIGEASAALHALKIVEGDAYGTEPDASWASGVREAQIMLHL